MRRGTNEPIVINLQGEIQRQADVLRSMEEPPDTPFGGRPYFSNLSLDNPPVSPHQLAQDDPRRPPQNQPRPTHYYRPPVPSHLSITPRRYGSIGGNTASSPSSLRPPAPTSQPPPPPHPLSAVSSPPTNLLRRHTSADIRQPNWPPQPPGPSPFNPAPQQQPQWPPSSPKHTEHQQLRDSLSTYSLQSASQPRLAISQPHSRPTTPPLTNRSSVESLNQWSWGTGRGDKFGGGGLSASGPPTRRGSMAHILNPAETAERDEEMESGEREEGVKRKRLG